MDFWEGSRNFNRQKEEQVQGLRSGRELGLGLDLGQEQREMGVTAAVRAGAGGDEVREAECSQVSTWALAQSVMRGQRRVCAER